jgi:hypothetical protein
MTESHRRLRVASGNAAIGNWGTPMHNKNALWLDCDLASLAMLLIGISAVSLLAVSTF